MLACRRFQHFFSYFTSVVQVNTPYFVPAIGGDRVGVIRVCRIDRGLCRAHPVPFRHDFQLYPWSWTLERTTSRYLPLLYWKLALTCNLE